MPWTIKEEGGKFCIYKEGATSAVKCHTDKAAADNQLAALYANEKTQLTVEIFAVGRWNGYEFTREDLISIADTFSKLGELHRVPLKFGHNDEQQMTDGQPALGWVSEVWVEGDKLMAKFDSIPDVVMKAIKSRLYRNVSVELDCGVEHKGSQYPFVLSGVALLGADIPAVNTINDLNHYLNQRAGFSAGRRAVFSAIAGKFNEGDDKVEKKLEELTATVNALSAKVETTAAANIALTRENETLKADLKKFSDAEAVRETTEKKARIDNKRAEVTALFEDAVKANAITPAQRTSFSKVLRVEDDAAVEALDINTVKELVGGSGFKFSKGNAHQDQADDRPVDVRVAEAANAIVAKGEAKDFASATNLLFSRDPELGREYINRE